MDIVIDFDGTCVTHEFPQIGKDIGTQSVLKKLTEKGHNLILFTMRSNRPEFGETGDSTILDTIGEFLTDAINWFKENEIPLYGIQTNPTQSQWTTSPKAYGQLIIDDAALGCPLKQDPLLFKEEVFLEKYGYSPLLSPVQSDGYCRYFVNRPYADWIEIEKWLTNQNIL